jgi:hypothetical protein
MKITAKVKQILPITGGTTANGTAWKKACVIVETVEQFPEPICLQNLKRADEFAQLVVGQTYDFDVTIRSREYNGRWYTEVSAWKWGMSGAQQQYQSFTPQNVVNQPTFTPNNAPNTDSDSLPF